MSLEGFNDDKLSSKSNLSREGDGLSSGQNQTTVATGVVDSYQVSVKKGEKASDSTQIFTGPSSGTRTGAGSQEDVTGWVTPTGNKIAINHAPGSDSIEIIHHSGAAVIIDVDGSIFITPSGRKGFGLHAKKGDGVVSAQGRLVLKGTSDITIETEGSMTFNVGKNMFMNIGGDLVMDVGGSMSESIDGAKSTEIVKDHSLTVGGTIRETVAGDKRTQVTESYRIDTGNSIDVRSDQDIQLQAQKSIKAAAVEASYFEVSSGKLTIASNDDTIIGAKNGIYLQSDDDVTLEAADTITVKGDIITTSSLQSTLIDAGATIDMRAAQVDVSATGSLKTYSGSTSLNTSGTFNIDATGAMTADAATISFNGGSPSPEAVKTIHTINARSAPNIQAPDAPEYPPKETIIDNMTSEREAPDFPGNAKKMSANDMSLYENEGDTPNANAKASADMNSSGGSTYSPGNSAGTLENSSNTNYDGSNNTTKSTNNPYPIPSSIINAETKISRHVTVGTFPGLNKLPKTQMGLSQGEILNNVSHLCYNILDPILEKFGSSVTLLHGIRLGSGGSRHYLGKAIDIRASSRDHSETAMIAKWIVENLPYDRCFLEANKQGTIHCHVEAAPPGTSGARVVWTCADPQCRSRTDGLQLSYAQQGLRKMGFFA